MTKAASILLAKGDEAPDPKSGYVRFFFDDHGRPSIVDETGAINTFGKAVVFDLYVEDGASLGGNASAPYVIGSNGEDILRITHGYSDPPGNIFLLLNSASPPNRVLIAPIDCPDVLIGIDGSVEWNGNTYTLADFPGTEGLRIVGSGGKCLELHGVSRPSDNGHVWSVVSPYPNYVCNIDWRGGKDNQDGYEERYTLSQAEYDGLVAMRPMQVYAAVIDFGATPAYEKKFHFSDTTFTAGATVTASLRLDDPDGSDEAEMEPFVFAASVPGDGELDLYVWALHGPVVGTYNVNVVAG